MEVRLMEPMCRHTSFRTGGPADWFVIPDTPEELAAALAVCKKTDTPWYILGNGTNLLVGDKGIRGLFSAWNGLTGWRSQGPGSGQEPAFCFPGLRTARLRRGFPAWNLRPGFRGASAAPR